MFRPSPRLITPNHRIGQLGWLKLTVPSGGRFGRDDIPPMGARSTVQDEDEGMTEPSRYTGTSIPWVCAVVLRGSRHHWVANSAHPGCFKGPTLDLGSRPTRSPRLRAGTSLTRVRSLVRVVTIQVSGDARQALCRKAFPIDPL
jgi:hypothetical protein